MLLIDCSTGQDAMGWRHFVGTEGGCNGRFVGMEVKLDGDSWV